MGLSNHLIQNDDEKITRGDVTSMKGFVIPVGIFMIICGLCAAYYLFIAHSVFEDYGFASLLLPLMFIVAGFGLIVLGSNTWCFLDAKLRQVRLEYRHVWGVEAKQWTFDQIKSVDVASRGGTGHGGVVHFLYLSLKDDGFIKLPGLTELPFPVSMGPRISEFMGVPFNGMPESLIGKGLNLLSKNKSMQWPA